MVLLRPVGLFNGFTNVVVVYATVVKFTTEAIALTPFFLLPIATTVCAGMFRSTKEDVFS